MLILLVVTALTAVAQEGQSFSKQMNEIKRSNEYVYAESSAPTEADAKAACDVLLKIEITKYLASVNPGSAQQSRLMKDISDYKRDYLTQTRAEMVRVFGYVAKSAIDAKEKMGHDGGGKDEKTENTPVPVTPTPVAVTMSPAAGSDPAVQSSPASSSVPLQAGDTDLARWQYEMLQSVVDKPDMMEAKKLLNRYKSQNRIKRLGDHTATNPRPADTYYLVFDNTGHPRMLLAPSGGNSRYDMLSGSTVDFFTATGGASYLWFQISK